MRSASSDGNALGLAPSAKMLKRLGSRIRRKGRGCEERLVSKRQCFDGAREAEERRANRCRILSIAWRS